MNGLVVEVVAGGLEMLERLGEELAGTPEAVWNHQAV